MSKKIFRTIAFQVDDQEFLQAYDQRQQDSGLSVKNYYLSLIKADIALHQTQDNEPVQQSGEAEVSLPEPEQTAPTEDIVEADTPTEAEELSDVEPEPLPEQTDEPPQNEDMMNLFVKITKEQREALEAHKLETGETVGNVMNRSRSHGCPARRL